MSFRVGTPNYGLPQTEGTDKRDWSDTNQPFLLIDTAIKNAVDTSASASSAASTAQQTADGAASAAAAAQTAAVNAGTAASTAGELAQAAKSRADNAYALADTANKVATYYDRVTITAASGDTYANALAALNSAIDVSKVSERTKLAISAGGITRIFNLSQRYQNDFQFSCVNIPGSATNWVYTIQVGSNPIYYRTTLGAAAATTEDITSASAGAGTTFTLLY